MQPGQVSKVNMEVMQGDCPTVKHNLLKAELQSDKMTGQQWINHFPQKRLNVFLKNLQTKTKHGV